MNDRFTDWNLDTVRVGRFSLGRTLATPGALAALEEAGEAALTFLARHAGGDLGDGR